MIFSLCVLHYGFKGVFCDIYHRKLRREVVKASDRAFEGASAASSHRKGVAGLDVKESRAIMGVETFGRRKELKPFRAAKPGLLRPVAAGLMSYRTGTIQSAAAPDFAGASEYRRESHFARCDWSSGSSGLCA